MTLIRDSETSPQLRLSDRATRLGIIGGGQLAKITAAAALQLGCEVVILDRAAGSPAAHLSPRSQVGNWNDPAVLARLAAEVDVVTLENEFVDASALRALEFAGHRVYPSADCLERTQDKLIQKQTLVRAGLPVAECCAVASRAEVLEAGARLGWPLLLKTRRDGYDGKGNFTVRQPTDVDVAWDRLGGEKNALLVEAFCHFAKELAVIVTRARDGADAVYPVVQTIQRDHVCESVLVPAELPASVVLRASELARRAVAAVGGVGSFGVELFLCSDDQILINELAPRVHNSGHYTIEACECSQFENHVRAVLGWPLGSTRLRSPAAAMVNVLGTAEAPGRPRGWEDALSVPGAHIHLYGKSTSGKGRKMGHVTALGLSVTEAWSTAERAARALHFSL